MSLLSKELKQKLLVDAWGGWKSLDDGVLDRLCDRMVELLHESIEEDHSECMSQNDYDKLWDEHQEVLNKMSSFQVRGLIKELTPIRV